MGNKRIQIDKKDDFEIVNYRRDNTICHILRINDVIQLLIIERYTENNTGRNRLRIRYILKILKDMKMESD